MFEFVQGTDAQFAALDSELSDCLCHVYKNRQLPASCTPDRARIGFERTADGYYILYIDKGIRSTEGNADFKEFLENGEAKFICMDDMIAFLHSLSPFFPLPSGDGQPTGHHGRCVTPESAASDTNTPVTVGGSSPAVSKPNQPECVYSKDKVDEIRAVEEEQVVVWPEEIAVPLKKKVFGQDDAIDDIATKIAKSRLRKDKKLLVMALIGPTATGKSETAKSLADVLTETTGTAYGFIEVAGSEFQEEHTISRFFGAPPGYVGYGNDTVLEPVRKNPYHVIVINEIEKSNVKMLTGLMEAMDTGMLGMADNTKPIDLNRCILFLTSNLPVDMDKYKGLSRFERSEICRDAFTRHCKRPEISGKIGNFIVFNPLTDQATLDIVAKFIKEEMRDYDLTLIHIDERLMVDFLKHQSKYGARAIRDLVSDSLGEHLLKNRRLESLKGKSVSLSGTIGNIEFEIV